MENEISDQYLLSKEQLEKVFYAGFLTACYGYENYETRFFEEFFEKFEDACVEEEPSITIKYSE